MQKKEKEREREKESERELFWTIQISVADIIIVYNHGI
jgi:hypothetical protein